MVFSSILYLPIPHKIILDKHHLLNEDNPKPTYQFFLSDITKNFEKITKKFFGKTIDLELKVL